MTTTLLEAADKLRLVRKGVSDRAALIELLDQALDAITAAEKAEPVAYVFWVNGVQYFQPGLPDDYTAVTLLYTHPPAAQPDPTIATLRAENERLRELLSRLEKWDHLDGAGDGPYWRKEISAALNGDKP